MSHATRIKHFTLEKKHIASLAWELDFYALRKLSASSYRVWHVIRAYAAFDNAQYSATLSQAFLAKQIGCSEKTIRRAIAEIKAKKLLVVQSNYSSQTGATANTYFIAFPEEAYAAVEAQDNKNSASYFTQPVDEEQEEAALENNAVTTPEETQEQTSKLTDQEVSTQHPPGANNDLNPPVKSDRYYREYNSREKNNRELVVSSGDNNHLSLSTGQPLSDVEEKLSRLSQQRHALNQHKHRLQQELKKVTPVFSEVERLSRLKQALQPTKNIHTNGSNKKLANDDKTMARNLREQLDVLESQQERLYHQEKFLQQARELEQHHARLKQDPYCMHQLGPT